MQIGLILLTLAFPLLELAVLIKVGQWLGLWWTIGLLIGTGIAGGMIINAQGLSAAQRAAQSLQEGKPPLEPVVDSFMLMIAGMLLLIPGLITDAMAVALLVPPVRRGVARWALSKMLSGAEVRFETHEWRSPGRTPPPPGEGTVIDGEWQRVDDPSPPAKPVSDDKRRPG